MESIKFPLLTKDDIELRIGQINKEGNKASLLLYQDARCGMRYLDQVLGARNWQKKYYEVRGLVICSLGININYEDPHKEPYWIWKDDTGSAGSIEEEKSIVSDSFKRCCVCVGLARELYTSPQVWVPISSKYDKFYVKEIGYNNNREINRLVITDNKGNVVYSYGVGGKSASNEPKNTKEQGLDNKQNVSMKEISATVTDMGVNTELESVKDYLHTLSQEEQDKFSAWLFNAYGETDINKLNEEKLARLVNTLRKANKIK